MKSLEDKAAMAGQPQRTPALGGRVRVSAWVRGGSSALGRFSRTWLMKWNPRAVSPAQEAAPGAGTCTHAVPATATGAEGPSFAVGGRLGGNNPSLEPAVGHLHSRALRTTR